MMVLLRMMMVMIMVKTMSHRHDADDDHYDHPGAAGYVHIPERPARAVACLVMILIPMI
jgi:hypothetical protein